MPARDACSPMRIPSWRGRSASPGTVGGFRARLVRRRERRLVQPVSCAPAHRSRGLTSAVDAALLHVSADLGARSAAVPPRGDGGYPGRLRPHRASAPGLGTAACSTPVQQPDDGRRAPNESVSVEHVPHKPSTNARPVHPRRTWGLFPGWCGDAAPSGGATAPYFPMRSREVLLRNAEHGIGGGKEVPGRGRRRWQRPHHGRSRQAVCRSPANCRPSRRDPRLPGRFGCQVASRQPYSLIPKLSSGELPPPRRSMVTKPTTIPARARPAYQPALSGRMRTAKRSRHTPPPSPTVGIQKPRS